MNINDKIDRLERIMRCFFPHLVEPIYLRKELNNLYDLRTRIENGTATISECRDRGVRLR